MAENEFTDEIAVTDSATENVTENVEESVVEETAVVDVQERKNKSKKITVLVTYLITVVCLLAGLLVPLFNWGFGDLSERMLLRYLPSMLDNVLAPFAKKQLIPASIPWFINVYTGKFDIASLTCVLYALLCVVSLFMIIPVCLGKKHKKTSVKCALAIEICAIIITAVYIVYLTYFVSLATGGARWSWNNFNMLIPLGGALIAAIIQSVLTKGSLGVSKTIGAILSTLAVISILDVAVFVGLLGNPLDNLSLKLKSGVQAAFFSGISLPTGMGIDGVGILYAIKDAAGTVFGSGAYIGTLYVLIILISILVLLNFVCDAIGLAVGAKYKKDGLPARNAGLNIFALVRYGATLVFAALLIILGIMKQGVTPGIYLYLLAALMLFALINAVVRTVVEFARAKKCATNVEEIENSTVADPGFEPQPDEAEAVYAQPAYEPVYEQPAYEQPVAEQQPVYEQPAYQQPVEQQPVYEQPAAEQPVYQQTVYEQPTYEQPQYQQPAYEQPTFDRSAYDRSAYDRSAYERSPYDRSSLYRQPAYDQPTFEDYEPEEEPLPEEPVKEEPVAAKAKETKAAEKPAPAPVPETIYVYSGDTDEFLETLTDKEKVEFVEVFIKKSKGTVNGVPDYHIKGDNADFFPAVFVHINRYRDKLSDALMGKMYKQLGR
ncbi:MAG: hypothetical protein K2O44_04725 [Clostridia bacterium]|nr:hypothetical protein [Clostridia bacterium]